MPDDERLREALLELKVLRDREARALQETRTLVDCLESYTAATSPGGALQSVFVSLGQTMGADLSLLLERDGEGTLQVRAASSPQALGVAIAAPIDVMARPRNVTDLTVLGDWILPEGFGPFAGLLVAPVADRIALVSLRAAPRSFQANALGLFERLSGLALQAYRASLIAFENELLAATISGSSSGFAISDATHPERPLVYVNAAFERITGYRTEEVLGRNCRFLSADAPDAPERTRLRRAVTQAQPGTFLLRNRRKTGEVFWNELTLFPVTDRHGAVSHIVATQSDVSDRIAAAQERDRVRARMEHALAATDDAFIVLEPDGRVAFANAAAEALFPIPQPGWSRGSTFAQNWAAYLEGCRDLPGRITRLLATPDLAGLAVLPSGREVDLPDGRTVLIRAGKLDDDGLVLSATDVTAMQSAQRLLAQRLAAIEAATDGIALTDPEGRLIYLNSAAASLLGYGSAETGLGRKWHRSYGGWAPPGGEPFHVTLGRATGSERPLTHEITGSVLDGGGFVIVLRDITESLNAENREKDLVRDLVRLQRQEAVAQLTAGVAHDFNNLLAAINGSAVLIGMEPGLPDGARAHLARITAAGAQSAKLVNRLLDMGAGAGAEGAFDLASVLKTLPDLLAPSLPRNVAFAIAGADPGPLALRGDANALSQVLVNLALNARDAIGARPGHVTLTVARRMGADVGPVVTGRVSGNAAYAEISVCDDGTGMTQETAAQVLQPYFTTKGRSGSGLGLVTSAMQVQAVGGALALETAPGQGTTVRVFWPLVSQEAPKPGAGVSALRDLSGMTVIVVDDDPDVSAVIASYLEARGAEATVCDDPRDAAEAIAENPDDWTALITDYDMPQMNGAALAEMARAAAPGLHILIVTALARRLSDPRIEASGVLGVFAKPLDLPGLSAALADTVKRETEGAS